MIRAEELVLKKADVGLDAAEEAELEILLRDPETAERCLELAEVEAALRAERADDALPGAVIDAVSRSRDARTEELVMGRVAAVRPAWSRRRSRVGALVAAAALAAVALSALGSAPIGSVLVAAADARVERGGELLPAAEGFRLLEGDALRSESCPLEVQIDGVAKLLIEPGSELVLAGARLVTLSQGELDADVLPQPEGRPLVIAAPHARAEILGTRLRLSAASDATRLEVRSGKVRLVRSEDGAEVLVHERQFSVAGADSELAARPVEDAEAALPEIVGFSLITLDAPREPIPGYEDLKDGAVVRLSSLPTRRINLRANTRPAKVGSVRFSTPARENFNTELLFPYTIVPHNGIKGPVWCPGNGTHSIVATPFTGTYGNGRRGEPRRITFTLLEDE